jgi:hypothetical protein
VRRELQQGVGRELLPCYAPQLVKRELDDIGTLALMQRLAARYGCRCSLMSGAQPRALLQFHGIAWSCALGCQEHVKQQQEKQSTRLK